MIAFIGFAADLLIIALFIAGLVVSFKMAKSKKKREEDFEAFMRGEYVDLL